MLAIRQACQALALVVLASPVALGKEPAKPTTAKVAPARLTFRGEEYVFRTSINNRWDFTPASQPDPKAWRDRVTIVVRDNVTTGAQLSSIASNLFATVGDVGEIVRTDSAPNARTHETDHFMAAKLEGKGFTQAAFGRVSLVEGKGMAIVYSHRSYGEHSTESSTGWMDRNGEATERELMAWAGMPKIAQLKALPASQ